MADRVAFESGSLARVQVVTRDPFGVLARAAAGRRVRRLTIVSPWLSCAGDRAVTLRDLVERVKEGGGAIVLLTRPPARLAHA